MLCNPTLPPISPTQISNTYRDCRGSPCRRCASCLPQTCHIRCRGTTHRLSAAIPSTRQPYPLHLTSQPDHTLLHASGQTTDGKHCLFKIHRAWAGADPVVDADRFCKGSRNASGGLLSRSQLLQPTVAAHDTHWNSDGDCQSVARKPCDTDFTAAMRVAWSPKGCSKSFSRPSATTTDATRASPAPVGWH